MALRLIEMIVPEDKGADVEELLENQPVVSFWREAGPHDGTLVKILLAAEKAESVLDLLEKRFSMLRGFKVIILPVEASLPRAEDMGPAAVIDKPGILQAGGRSDIGRMYREEVYSDIRDAIRLSRTFLILAAVSSLAAAIGMIYGNIPVIIGAMVVAPLLGPNVALAFATTLGDTELAKHALRASAAGMFVALILPVAIGLAFSGSVDPKMPEIEARVTVRPGDVVIALVAGVAGGLAFTTGVSTALVGVMVAVALLPPLAAFGLLIGAGFMSSAAGALLLLITNLICVNLAGVVTFLSQGIQPTTWWEATKAKKATREAVILWVLLLSALIVVIVVPGLAQ